MAEVTIDTTPVAALEGSPDAATETPTEVRPLRQPAKPDAGGFVWGTGRRKAAVARVRIRAGSGVFLIKGREIPIFFSELRDQADCMSPLKVTQMEGKIDVFVNAHGGGYMGQAGAVKLGLARALIGYDPTLETILREHNLLSRDPRRVERKKYGQRGARRRFQFSKR